jgi:N-acetylglucosaminyldiphosphoundecaprenol N-acetyl-beta-D-mannosaminyltransferase
MVKENIFTFPVSIGSYQKFIDEIFKLSELKTSSYVCFANVHMIVEAYNDPVFNSVVKNADIVTPDGQPIALFLQRMKKIDQVRVAGLDVFPDLLREAELRNKSVYFYGATDQILQMIIDKARGQFPALKIKGSYSPPFRKLTPEEDVAVTKVINDAKPDLVFVALGCPKQEQWMARHRPAVKGCMLGVGHAFKVYAGVSKRAPEWMQRLSVEWVYRLFQEPGRLWKRYFYTNTFFLWLTFKYFLSSLFDLNQEKPKVLYKCDYSLVWVPLYRFRVLTGSVAETLTRDISYLCTKHGCSVKDLAIHEDHIHLRVSIPPKLSVSNLMDILKKGITVNLLKSHPSLKRNYAGRFWVNGYLVSTDGLTEDTVRRYVKRQESAGV